MVTLCQNEVSHQIFMSSLPPVVGCLRKTWLTKGGGVGHGHPRTPLADQTCARFQRDIFQQCPQNIALKMSHAFG